MSIIRSTGGASTRDGCDPQTRVMQRAYRFWAPFYDIVCGRLFLTSRTSAAAAAGVAGRRVLEIGVGTGRRWATIPPQTS